MSIGLVFVVLLMSGLVAASFLGLFIAIWWQENAYIFDRKWWLVPIVLPVMLVYDLYSWVTGRG